MKKLILIAMVLAGFSTACRTSVVDDSPDLGTSVEDGGTTVDASTSTDTGTVDGSDGEADAGTDAAEQNGCLQVSVSDGFVVSSADDVSIEYSSLADMPIEGKTRELSLLFERYGDATYEGTFELGADHDANFGNCAHCFFIRTDTRERAFFADRGTFVSNSNPFSRRLDIEVTDLRLIEVAVDPLTRESTPIDDGACIEVADFAKSGSFPPAAWRCAPDNYNNGVACDCECGTYDPDCGSGADCLPGDPSCSGPSEPLPIVGCDAAQVCTFEPVTMDTQCADTCDWIGRSGCATGTCVFDFGVGDGDLCIDDPRRVSETTMFGDDCPGGNLQVLCNVVDGFAEGYCGPNNICRPVCQSDAECTVAGETCRQFRNESPLGYCGPVPTDG